LKTLGLNSGNSCSGWAKVPRITGGSKKSEFRGAVGGPTFRGSNHRPPGTEFLDCRDEAPKNRHSNIKRANLAARLDVPKYGKLKWVGNPPQKTRLFIRRRPENVRFAGDWNGGVVQSDNEPVLRWAIPLLNTGKIN